jgi:hypothetical protein
MFHIKIKDFPKVSGKSFIFIDLYIFITHGNKVKRVDVV